MTKFAAAKVPCGKVLSTICGLGLFMVSFAPLSAATSNAHFTIHLLNYLAKDYAGAVQDGKVISPEEYNEQIEFADRIVTLLKEDAELSKKSTLQTQAAALNAAVKNKNAAEQ